MVQIISWEDQNKWQHIAFTQLIESNAQEVHACVYYLQFLFYFQHLISK